MLEDKDIQKLIEAQKEVFATKTELANMFSVVATKEELNELKEEVSGLRQSVQALTISIDKLVKSFEIYRQEQIALASKVDRLEKWINQIAKKVGIKLEP